MKKKLILHIPFEVTIDESAIPQVAKEDEGDEEVQAYLDRQHRLFHAVIDNPEILKTFTTYLLASDLESASWQTWYDMLLHTVEADPLSRILQPAIALLDTSDQAFFAEAEDMQSFFECTEEFQMGITAKMIDDPTITENGGDHEQ